MKPLSCAGAAWTTSVLVLLCAVLGVGAGVGVGEARGQATHPAGKPTSQRVARAQWGAPEVTVSTEAGQWRIVGKKQTVTLRADNLAVEAHGGAATWAMVQSGANDMLVKSAGEEFPLRLADAGKIDIQPWDTGFRTGVKITLSGWKHKDKPLELTLYLTMGLEGRDEDLVFEVAADERHGTVVRQLDWPTALDAHDVDCTLLSNHRGVMLPRNWPKPYFPIRSTDMGGNPKVTDTSEVQSNVIESWSMSWWGFQRGESAMMIIVETPDDAAYQFEHPAGGPTVIGPRWRASLGRLAYMRTARMCFFPKGNYVDMAKRYRQHAIDNGTFVSLKEKIARQPKVKDLIGTPMSRVGILTNITSDSLRYSTTNPAQNYRMTTFDERAKQLRGFKEKGLQKLNVCVTGWPNQGYDRQHPDELPPAPIAGGVEGMKRLGETCREIGYLFSLHDQYRDYYTDAPSYDKQFAVHEEDEREPSKQFPGSRFGQWKEGRIPFMNNWDGGVMGYMNNRLMPGHLIKNYTWLLDHGIKLDGTYLDVFGYVPPDEDFNPEHPTTRSDAIRARAACFIWSRNHIGFVGTEAGCDWTVPYADVASSLRSNKGVPVPLFNLVYHDAMIIPYAPDDLRGFLNGGLPQIRLSANESMSSEDLARVERMRKLHERVALTEMTKHEFLDEKFRKERTTFSDGTTVTVDWDSNQVTINPE